jgi:DNA replication protein DnaC
MTTQAIAEGLKELHLPTIKKRFEDLAQKAVKEGATFEQYLLWLVEEERADRKENRVARRLVESKIPSTKTWENFDFKRLPPKLTRQFKGLLSGEFLKRKENILRAKQGANSPARLQNVIFAQRKARARPSAG